MATVPCISYNFLVLSLPFIYTVIVNKLVFVWIFHHVAQEKFPTREGWIVACIPLLSYECSFRPRPWYLGSNLAAISVSFGYLHVGTFAHKLKLTFDCRCPVSLFIEFNGCTLQIYLGKEGKRFAEIFFYTAQFRANCGYNIIIISNLHLLTHSADLKSFT